MEDHLLLTITTITTTYLKPLIPLMTLAQPPGCKVNFINPAGRTGNPIDIANAELYLASDELDYVTRASIVMDGGWSVPCVMTNCLRNK